MVHMKKSTITKLITTILIANSTILFSHAAHADEAIQSIKGNDSPISQNLNDDKVTSTIKLNLNI